MKKKKIQTVLNFLLLVLIYFVVTTVIYKLAIIEGNSGITLNIFGGGDDGYFYWQQALNVAKGNSWINTSIYPYIIGKLLSMLDIYDVYIIRLFNWAGFILLIVYSIKLIKFQIVYQDRINRYRYSSYNFIIFFFLSYLSLQMNTNLSIYRDVWIYFFFILLIFLSSNLFFNNVKKISTYCYFCISIFIMAGLRAYALVSFLMGIILYLIFTRVKKPILYGMIIILLFGIYYTFFLDVSIPILNMSLRGALNYRRSTVEVYQGGSQMGINLVQPNFIIFLTHYIYSFIGNLIGPLPHQVTSFGTALVFLFESLPMLYILKKIYKFKKHLNEIHNYILLQAFTWNGFIAVSNDNIGTATRLRVISWILITIVFINIYFIQKVQRTE